MSAWTPIILWLGLVGPGAGGEENYRSVKPVIYEREKKEVPDIWILESSYNPPRLIMVNVPGKGRKMLWYMTYKIVNKTGQPRTFIPSFELVATGPDRETKVYKDVILPQAEAQVTLREDPTRPLQNSVMMAKPIPPTPSNGAPIVRYGVVFWEDVDMTYKNFTIFITGLSNGYHRIDDPSAKGKEKLLRKTLKIEYFKPGDEFNPRETEIKKSGDPTWIYR